MKTYTLPLSATKSFSQLVNDYLTKDSFFENRGGSIWTEQQWQEALEAKGSFFKTEKRLLLIDVITKQYESLNLRSPQRQIDLLKEGNTFTVCCAHQPNLMGGPMYTIVKIAATIALAKKLSTQFPKFNFVPVYYIGSEDHDVQELNHLFIQNDKIEWNVDTKGAFGSSPCEGSAEILQQIQDKLAQHPFTPTLYTILSNAYASKNTMAQASFTLMHELFKEQGLLCLDANNHALKESFVPVIQEELFCETAHNTLEQDRKNWELKYPIAVEFRPINLFYLDANKRSRIIRNTDASFTTADGSMHWSEEELRNLTKTKPEAFSPNAVLRPVYQEWILPNIAFVGGGSEVAYWKQVYPIFEKYKTPYPAVQLRNSISFIDTKFEKRTAQLAYTWEKWFLEEEQLIQEIIAKSGIEWSKESALFQSLSNALETKSASIDKGLETATGAAIAQINKAMEGLEKKWTQAIKRKEEDQINAIKKGKQHLQPNGILQERRESFLPFIAKYGFDIIPQLITAFENSDSSKFLLINPEADV